MVDMSEGFDSNVVLEMAEVIKKVYPELAGEVDGIVKAEGGRKCCGGASVAGKAIARLCGNFKYDGRDLSTLDGIGDERAFKTLRNETPQPTPADSSASTVIRSILSSCADCVAEHIAEAILFAYEAEHGYPWKRHLVVASLEHAAFESHAMWPEFAGKCHDVKLAYRNKNRYDLEKLLKEADALK